jgi:hypothetical protein
MRECANCGASMLQDQDWCVQCGAARPGLLRRRPGWLTAAGVLAVTALLVVGASVAAYAALSKHGPKAHKQLALHAPTTVVPSTTPGVPSTTTPTTPTTVPPTPNSSSESPPPKIPTQTPTPEGESNGSANELLFPPEEKSSKAGKSGKAGKSSKSSGGGKGSTEGLTGGGVEEGPKGEGSGGSGSNSSEPEAEGPEPILLDTNAASTYNPNAYSSSLFGDPSLTIDGDASTAWTAEVQASLAPQVNVGIVLDLRTAQKLAKATIKTKTPGITIEMYGANGHNLPALITDQTWKKLHGPRLLKKKKVTLKLKTKGAAYRFVLLWIAKAPASSTSADPGKVAIRELELFPPA